MYYGGDNITISIPAVQFRGKILHVRENSGGSPLLSLISNICQKFCISHFPVCNISKHQSQLGLVNMHNSFVMFGPGYENP